jgi:peptide-methionine (S)-S-oxide reductase
VEAVFEHLRGVHEAVSGYAGGGDQATSYGAVSTGRTGYAEAVRVVYDPRVISYRQLLEVFFTVAHDPTQLNRQGPDVGTQYRSALFFRSARQRREAEAYLAELRRQGVYRQPIVTRLGMLDAFHPAEAYHQNYLVTHPTQPYIVHHDLPKLRNLQRRYPILFRALAATPPL